jgi:hypothetical protein
MRIPTNSIASTFYDPQFPKADWHPVPQCAFEEPHQPLDEQHSPFSNPMHEKPLFEPQVPSSVGADLPVPLGASSGVPVGVGSASGAVSVVASGTGAASVVI